MAHDRPDGDEEAVEEIGERSPSSSAGAVRPTPPSPYTLASLLELDEAELAQPLPRVAPADERWEQLTLGVMTDAGDEVPSPLRSASATSDGAVDHPLIPGLDAPGAVEVPVYLAGRALHDLLAESAPPDSADETGDAVECIDGEVETRRNVTPEHLATTPPKPQNPPALVTPVSGGVRRSMDPPVANFAKADSAQVLWPKPSTPVAAWVARTVCEQCGIAMSNGTCRTCRGDTAGRGPTRLLRRVVARLVRSEHRSVCTLATLVLVPGELTVAHLTGQTRRYAGTTLIAVLALILFTLISMFGSLRPRPDRSLGIGTEQTPEVLAGLRDRTPVDLARDEPPGLLRDLASTLNDVPVLWLPLASVLVLGLVAVLLAPELGDGEAATVFTTHAMSWFVLWWGVGVPLLLLLLKSAFESAAASVGDGPLAYLADGGVAGVPEGWNAARTIVISGDFHSLMLALGFTPWLAAAWRRTFAAGRARSAGVALLISAIPILLLTPFT